MSARGAARVAATDRDDSWLLGLAGRVCAALRRSTVVDVKLKLSRPRATDTSGWLIVVGASRGMPGTQVEMWFDHWFGLAEQPVLWYGLRWNSRRPFLRACGRWDRQIRRDRQIRWADVTETNGVFTMKKPRRAGVCYLERYADYYLGRYATEQYAKTREPDLISAISTFIDTALTPEGQVDLGELDSSMLRQPQQGSLLRAEDPALIRYAHRARTVEVERLHVRMMNTLKALVNKRGFRARGGPRGLGQYDALVEKYNDAGRDVLIEVKSTVDHVAARLAVGQLLDYRRHLPRARTTDLAVLFPSKPPRSVRDFLDHVNIEPCWLHGRTVQGRGRLAKALTKTNDG